MNAVTIVNVGYRSTNFWVVSAGRLRLLVDLGWPGLADDLLHALERADIPFVEIRYGFATHYHIDHAGAAQDLKARGMPLLVFEEQVAAIPAMKQHIKPSDHYTEIVPAGNVVKRCDESRALLAGIGIAGEEDARTVHASWARLRALGARQVYGGHARPYPMPAPQPAPTEMNHG